VNGSQREPIVRIVASENIKVRAFDPETRVRIDPYGETVRATVDGGREAMFIAMNATGQTLD